MKRTGCLPLWAMMALLTIVTTWGSGPLFAQTIAVGKVDLLAVMSFHPRMALFDPAIGAFYRLEVQDLFRPDLEARLTALSKGASSAIQGTASSAASVVDPAFNGELQAIEQRRRELLRILDTSQDTGKQAQAERELGQLAQKMAAAERVSAEQSFRQHHPQFTSSAETATIFREIEQEILSSIDQLSRERGFTVVFNQSTLPPASVPSLIEVAPVNPAAASRVATSLYFAFLGAQTPAAETLENWTAASRHPQMLAKAPLRPYPLVLSGGQDLTIEVLDRVLQRNAVPEEKRNQILSHLRGLLSETR